MILANEIGILLLIDTKHFKESVMPRFIFAYLLMAATSVAIAAPETVSFKGARERLTLSAELYKPAGDGPHPSVVMLHGCNGVKPYLKTWAEKLQSWGYAALLVDSLGPRDAEETCANPFRVSPAARSLDAYGGYLWLAEQAWADKENIGLVGWSHGGWTALKAVSGNGMWRYTEKMNGKTFKAAATIYPSCKTSSFFVTPLLILIGEADTLTTAKDCVDMIDRRHEKSTLPEMHTYPGAYHAYDSPAASGDLMGHKLAFDEAATKATEEHLKAFLARELKSAE